MAYRPWPPPSATTFGRRSAVGVVHSRPRSRWTTWTSQVLRLQPPGRVPRRWHTRAVFAAGAADRDGQIALALALVAGAEQVEQLDVPVEELAGALLGEHVVGDLRVLAGQVAQLRDPERVGQEPHVDHQVGVQRQAVLVAEGQQGQRGRPVRPGEAALDGGAQLVHGLVGGVDDHVGLVAQRAEQRALGGQPVGQPAAALQRVLPPVGLEPADQHRVGRLQEQHPRPVAAGVEILDHRGQIVGERPRPDVEDHRDPGHPAPRPGAQVDHGGDQLGRQVVDDEPAEVLQALGRGRPAGAGQAGDDRDLDAGRRHRRRRRPRRRRARSVGYRRDRAGRSGPVTGLPAGVAVGWCTGSSSATRADPRDAPGRSPVDRSAPARFGGSPVRGRGERGDDGLGRRPPDAGHHGDLLGGGPPHLGHRAEVPQQRLAPGRARGRGWSSSADTVIDFDRFCRW